MSQDYFIALDGVTIGYRTSTGVFIRVCKAEDNDIANTLLSLIQGAGYNIDTQPIDGW